MSEFGDTTLLGDARGWLREHVEEGEHCPLCTQYAKVYRRKLNSGMAVSLIRMWRKRGKAWVNVPDEIGARSREEGKLRYWGLVQERDAEREDGGRAGWWRVTEPGERFVLLQIRVPKYARIYDGRCLGLTGEPVTLLDCLGDKFDYAELMRS